MKIICKTTILPAPFIGTSVEVHIPADDLDISIYQWIFAEGSSSVKIDWGDGVIEHVTATTAQHIYPAEGDYTIRLSDDLVEFGMGYMPSSYEHGPKIIKAYSNATKLTKLSNHGFRGCANLTEIDFSQTKLAVLGTRCFESDAALAGRIDLPHLTTVEGLNTFNGCVAIREIHFSKAHEAEIKSCHYWELHPDLGAVNATITFDP